MSTIWIGTRTHTYMNGTNGKTTDASFSQKTLFEEMFAYLDDECDPDIDRKALRKELKCIMRGDVFKYKFPDGSTTEFDMELVEILPKKDEGRRA